MNCSSLGKLLVNISSLIFGAEVYNLILSPGWQVKRLQINFKPLVVLLGQPRNLVLSAIFYNKNTREMASKFPIQAVQTESHFRFYLFQDQNQPDMKLTSGTILPLPLR